MLKPYHHKDNPTTCRPVANVASVSDCPPDDSVNPSDPVENSMKLHNSDVLLNLDRKLNHLPEEQRALINKLLRNLLTCSLMFQEGQLLLIIMLRWMMLIPSNSILTSLAGQTLFLNMRRRRTKKGSGQMSSMDW